MSEFEIKCPNCGTVVTADDVMKKHLDHQMDEIKANAKLEADKANKETIEAIQKNAKEEVDAAKAAAKEEAVAAEAAVMAGKKK